MNWTAYCSIRTGANSRSRTDAPSWRTPAGSASGARSRAVTIHARSRTSARSRGSRCRSAPGPSEAVGEERDQRDDRDRLAGDAPELLELRRLRAGDLVARCIRSSRSQSRSRTDRRVSRSRTAAGGTEGRSRARRRRARTSPPPTARSVPTTRAVVTRTWARSAIIAPPEAPTGAAEVPDRGEPSERITRAVTVELAVRDPARAAAAPPARRPRPARHDLVRSDDPQPAGALGHQHRVALVAMPAATIGRTETSPRSASSVTNASCSTCA